MSRSPDAASSPYMSLIHGAKETANGHHASSSSSSHVVARKDPSVIHQCSPGHNEQQKVQRSPVHTMRPSSTSSTSLKPQASPKSRASDVKHRKTSPPPCSRESPHSRPRTSKPEKSSEGRKKPDGTQKNKLVKKERKGDAQKTSQKDEERKKRKKKEEKRIGERKNKRDKAARKERKLDSKNETTEKKITPLANAKWSGESPLTADRAAHPRGTSPHPSSKCENQKKCKKKSPTKQSLTTSKMLAVVPSKSGPKSDETLPSLLFEALAPLSTACSVSIQQPANGKEGGQGGLLNAPDLQPVAMMGSFRELGDNLANTPPVLSWQGSPVSVLGEDEDELEKGVIHRPVLQPSPTQCFSPPPVDENIDHLSKESCESPLADHDHDSASKPCEFPSTVVEKEKQDKVERETSGSLLRELHHHKAGLDDVFKSLANFLGGQRVTCRGGPFGGPPSSATKGIKFASSLTLGPDIHSQEHQDFPLKTDPTSASEHSDRSPTHATSDAHSHTTINVCEPLTVVQKKQEEPDNDEKERKAFKEAEIHPERTESSLLDESLSAELRLTATHTASFTSILTVSTKDKKEIEERTENRVADRKRKHKAKNGRRGGEIQIKIKKQHRDICLKNKANEKNDLKERNARKTPVSSSVPVISRNSLRPPKDSVKGQKRHPAHSKEKRKKTKPGDAKVTTLPKKKKELAKTDTKTSSSASTITINTPKECLSTAASKTVDPLKLKALSMGLSKELRILLIKVESAGRQTFNISELEEQRIPFTKISIENTAAQVIRACK